MREPAIRTHLMLVIAGLLALGATGCPDSHHGTSAYCDDSGCFECDAEKNCWPVNNPRCSGDSACEPGSVCTTIGCARPCKTSDECSGDDACVTGYCAPPSFTKIDKLTPPAACESDANCKPDELCDDGKCIPRCTSDDDCGPDSVCAPCGKCQPKGTPPTCGASQIFCSETIPCGNGKTCLSSRCHLQCSGAGAVCPIGQVCSAGLCIDDPAPAKPECLLDTQCGGGICINGYCHGACATSIQCGAGALCQMGICQPDYTPAK